MFASVASMSMRRTCALIACATAGLLAGCFEPRTPADELAPGLGSPTDLFAPDASSTPSCPTPDPSPLSRLRVRVRTTPVGGNFAPRNVGAVWIERAGGGFVKTLERWGQIRAKWLSRFITASSNNVVDAVTGATLLAHQTHDLTWDLTDLAHCEITAGGYQVVFELTDRDGPGASFAVDLSKDQAPVTLTPADTPYFHDLLIDLN